MSGRPPPPPPEYLAHETHLPRILGITTTFHVIALAFVALRVYARVFVVKAFGKDDFCIVVAALCALGGWITFVLMGSSGLGRHAWSQTPAQYKEFMHVSFWQSIISAILALAFLKLSIGFGLLRLSTHKWYNIAIWSTMGIVVCYSIVGLCSFFFNCKIMAAYWDLSLKQDCYPFAMFIEFALVNTSFNIATDVLFATYPVPIIWTLQMPRKTRIYLVAILSLGYFAVGMGLAKAIVQIAYAGNPDRTFDFNVQVFGFLQLNLGIIAACAATLKPLVNRILKLGSTGNSGQNKSGPSTLHTWGSSSFGKRKNDGHERLGTRDGQISRTRGKGDANTNMDDLDGYELESANGGGGKVSPAAGTRGKRDSEMFPVMGAQGQQRKGNAGGDVLYPANGAVVQGGRGLYKGDDASSSERILGEQQYQQRQSGRGIVVATEFGVKS